MESQAEQGQQSGRAWADHRRAHRDQGPGISSPDEAGALARVVAVEGSLVWLEPMQGGSCGGCASAAACGSKGLGTIASRLEFRRFAVRGESGLRVGDSVEVAFGDRNLVKAAAVAYVIPLFFAFAAAAFVQSLAGRDGLTMLGALAGLGLGLAAMKAVSSRLEARGALEARIVRRLGPAVIPIFPTGA